MTCVSIIIPCRNEAAHVEAKVADCFQQAGDGLEVEVLVADDASDDDTAARAEAAGARVIPNTRGRGKWSAVLCAVERARGELVCVTDADVRFEPGALARAAAAFDDPRVGAACGVRRMVRGEDGRPAGGLYDAARMAMIRFYSWLDSTPTLCGPMMLFRRELLKPIESRGLRADDIESPMQIRRRGFKAKVCAFARFLEPEPPAPARRRQALRRAEGIAQAYWRHRSALFNPRLGWFGLVAYPMEFAFYFLLPWAVWAGLAGLAVLAWRGSRWALAACAVVAAEELWAAARRRPSALGQAALMTRAMLRVLRGRDAVTDHWRPSREA